MCCWVFDVVMGLMFVVEVLYCFVMKVMVYLVIDGFVIDGYGLLILLLDWVVVYD